ncbi:recovery protein 3 [Striga asiatica]|uniref:Recovery protein 3 n=1 Tax=Striga asiatica TaxID=4170 RepID=A0A5A7QRM0_STRAF|nr:recovery protein 3 [Striga asiatica]
MKARKLEKRSNLFALLGSIKASSASLSAAIAFFAPDSASYEVPLEFSSIELLRLCLCPEEAAAAGGPPSNPSPSKKSASTERLLKWAMGLTSPLFLGWATGGGGGGPAGRREGLFSVTSMLKSARTPSRSMSSKSSKRKKVSDWARRWWTRRVGVSGIWSKSARPGGFPEKLGSIRSSKWKI